MSEPPLLALAKGKKVRLRSAIPEPQTELHSIHIPIVNLLRAACNPNWIWTHIGHGGMRLDIRTAVKLKAMGLQPGWPDFVFIGSPRIYGARGQVAFLELKRKGGRLSENQRRIGKWLDLNNVPFRVADNINDAMDFLEHHNIVLTRRNKS